MGYLVRVRIKCWLGDRIKGTFMVSVRVSVMDRAVRLLGYLAIGFFS